MHFTPFKKDDGYFESVVSLSVASTPIIKLRVVETTDKRIEFIVRDFNSGELFRIGYLDSKYSKKKFDDAIGFAMEFLRSCIIIPGSRENDAATKEMERKNRLSFSSDSPERTE